MRRQRKALTAPVEWKAEDGGEGTFRAVFSTFHAIDLDGDITLPGAFENGSEVLVCGWGHDWGGPNIGKGVIDSDQSRAWIDGQFYLDTAAGLDTYRTVKNNGRLQEWSYGFDIVKRSEREQDGAMVRVLESVKVYEVSPVMLGAGVDTHTEAIKAAAAPPTIADALEQLEQLLASEADAEAVKAAYDRLEGLTAGLSRRLAPPPPDDHHGVPVNVLRARLRLAQSPAFALGRS